MEDWEYLSDEADITPNLISKVMKELDLTEIEIADFEKLGLY